MIIEFHIAVFPDEHSTEPAWESPVLRTVETDDPVQFLNNLGFDEIGQFFYIKNIAPCVDLHADIKVDEILTEEQMLRSEEFLTALYVAVTGSAGPVKVVRTSEEDYFEVLLNGRMQVAYLGNKIVTKVPGHFTWERPDVVDELVRVWKF